MNLEQARFNMIEQQIRPWDVLDADVLEILTLVKREAFVPPEHRNMAFVDTEIPLPCGENMLQPKFEARILQELMIRKHEQVLEIGTGSGYMAALMSYQARAVTTVEIHPELVTMARASLMDYGIDNVDVEAGDGICGWPAPDNKARGIFARQAYDIIVLSGSVPIMPQQLMQQLKVGGRMFVVTGDRPAMSAQIVTRMSDAGFNIVKRFETVIKPLRNALQPSRFTF